MDTTSDYDDPEIEEAWCNSARIRIIDYLREEKVEHGRVGDWPAWHIAPIVSIWAIESLVRPEWIGWWVICGDLPTDYIPATDVEPPQHPRKALRVFATKWQNYAKVWSEGKEVKGFRIRGCKSHKDLAPLLATRAEIFSEWVNDDSFWEDDE